MPATNAKRIVAFCPVVGPGIWSWVEDLGIGNDTISSLALSTSPATVSNSVDNHVVLFGYTALYGAHRHVFAAEPNLNADDDNFFNDNVGSLAVLAGDWSFYSDANFHGLYGSYGTPVVPGNYPDLTQLSITLVGAGRESGDDYQVVMEGSLAEV